MGDSYINNTWNISYNYSNNVNKTDDNHEENMDYLDVGVWVAIVISLAVTLAALFAVFSLIRKDQAAPIYVINLLISDLIQLCSGIGAMIHTHDIYRYSYTLSNLVSIGFMLCISLERYLVIAWPLWYRFRRNIKMSVVISVLVWTLSLVWMLILFLALDREIAVLVYGGLLLFPFPFFVFFLVGTLRALSAAISVAADEKRRIIAILILMLIIYTLLFLPTIFFYLVKTCRENLYFNWIVDMFLIINPLSDSLMYVFLRKGAVDSRLASLCCKMCNHQEMSGTYNDTMLASCTETV